VTSLLIALQFLTRIPLPFHLSLKPDEMGRSMRWFPLVGAMLGGCVAIVDFALAALVAPEVRSVLLVALLAVLTGALHLDGVMDSCDGLLAFTSRERRLEIMSDSRVGSFAVVGLTTALLLKYAAFLSLPDPLRLPGFIAMGGLSRWAMVYTTVLWPDARGQGLGHTYKQGAGRLELVWASVLAAVALVPLAAVGLAAAGVAVLSATALAWYATRKIGGLTGDVYGAVCEAVEILVVLALPPLARGMLTG